MLNQNLLKFIKDKSPSMVENPLDMKEFSWFHSRSEENRNTKTGWVKYYSRDEEISSNKDYPIDFTYYINDMGFRGKFPDKNSDQIIGFFGCSVTFGQGLPENQIYPDIISKHYNKECLNLGVPGASIRQTALIFSAATTIWNIETAIINLPPISRFFYADSKNNTLSILLQYTTINKEIETVRNDILNHFSEQFLLLQAIESIQWIIDISKLKNINLILATYDEEVLQLIKTAFRKDIILMNHIDTCRDNHHGEKSHKKFAEDIIKTINIL